MTNPSALLTKASPITHALLRIGTGLLFMQHGVQKLFGWLGGFGGTPDATADLFTQMGLAGVLEVFGGLLIVLGLFTRPVAIVLVVEMLAAYVIAHMPRGGFPIQNGGELALLYALTFTLLTTHGAGPASLDHLISQRRRNADTEARREGVGTKRASTRSTAAPDTPGRRQDAHRTSERATHQVN